MSYLLEKIADHLKAVRKEKGLSQRALAQLTGLPQSHISKIERGVVDMRLSSLVEIARVLELELELVPRPALPAVQAIIRFRHDEATHVGAVKISGSHYQLEEGDDD